MGDRAYPKGIGTYKKLTKAWENYNNSLVDEFLSLDKVTQKEVGKLLVKNNWFDKILSYAWRSYLATGLSVLPDGTRATKENFGVYLKFYETYDGKKVDAIKNSAVPKMSQSIAKKLKKGIKEQSLIINTINTTDDVAYISKIFKRIDKPTKAQKKALSQFKADPNSVKKSDTIKGIIVSDIKTNQYKATVENMVEKTMKYQGKRLSQDQWQRSNNEFLIKKVKDGKKEVRASDNELILEGEWKLSPEHTSHMANDPCEEYADIRFFYGGDIPIPIRDTHFGCQCSLRTRVIEKKNKQK